MSKEDIPEGERVSTDLTLWFYRKGTEQNGFTPVWLVDEYDRQVHTEPVCSVCTSYHGWFVDWLDGMRVVVPRSALEETAELREENARLQRELVFTRADVGLAMNFSMDDVALLSSNRETVGEWLQRRYPDLIIEKED